MSLLLGKAIYSILTGDTLISQYVNDKVYPIFAPDSVLNPFIVYSFKTSDANYTKDGLIYDTCLLTVNIISNSFSESINIASLVRKNLERKTGIYSGVQINECLVSSISEDYGVDGYITTIEFTVKCK